MITFIMRITSVLDLWNRGKQTVQQKTPAAACLKFWPVKAIASKRVSILFHSRFANVIVKIVACGTWKPNRTEGSSNRIV